MERGQKVEVHTNFNDSWSPGFVVDAVVDDGYRLKRLSDGALLPGVTGEDDLRPAPSSSWTWRDTSRV